MPSFSVPDGKVPAAVWAAVKKAVRDSGPVTEEQITAAKRLVRGLSSFPEFREALIDYAIRDMVYDYRSRVTHDAKYRTEHIRRCETNRVRSADSDDVQEIYGRSLLKSHFIGGTALGRLRFEQLPGLKKQQRAIGDGSYINADLIEWLESKDGRPQQMVEEVVTERQVRRAFDRISARYGLYRNGAGARCREDDCRATGPL